MTVNTPVEEDERMLREVRPNSSNTAELLQLMEKTRTTRRLWIDADQPTITAVLKRYPRLQDMNKAVSMQHHIIHQPVPDYLLLSLVFIDHSLHFKCSCNWMHK
jgi:hypothetical protein